MGILEDETEKKAEKKCKEIRPNKFKIDESYGSIQIHEGH